MSYYIYENWQAADKAMVHMGNCSYCNYGQGHNRTIHGDKNGIWHGPFTDHDSALLQAKSLNRIETRNCKVCL